VVVIDNASDPAVSAYINEIYDCTVDVIRDEQHPPNLYRLWNIGFNHIDAIAKKRALTEWNIGVFNDDALPSPGWLTRVRQYLRGETPAVIATTPAHTTVVQPTLKTQRENNLGSRMCPWAFVVKGEVGLRADEDFGWWYGDTDLECRARLNGGVLLVPEAIPHNTCANSTTVGALAEQAGRDGETFARKWGGRPW